MVRITVSKTRYIEPFLTEYGRACQGGGSYKASFYAVIDKNLSQNS